MVVQKFGGTSVADPAAIRRLIAIVRTARARDGRGPAVVVSAMSGVTDALLAIASGAGADRLGEALPRVDEIRERHLAAARELVPDAERHALIASLSELMTLAPGDLVSTGTPAGVGSARDPAVWLEPGDEIVISSPTLGELRTTFA